ncbi:MAG TPA: cyclopropane fatty acyl phospholipid synthase [Spirochaetota bacterium]|nr:cyclopropane fatty acyl phospholipid synthase [Spirochaetota bacterium]HPR50097.1 cyclopropane fatty acyl phospholipid synthase [Spirochaetota bacterium]
MNRTIIPPKRSKMYQLLAELLGKADIRIDGTRPWDMRLNDPSVPQRILARGSLGLGESYMDGHWEAKRLDEFFHRLLRAGVDRCVKPPSLIFFALCARLFNRQNTSRAWKVGEVHYDLGNDFYREMLDRRMTYSCASWENARTLDEAQESKLDMICRKLRLGPGMTVLDIGCGWGSFMCFAAEHYGAKCTGVTVSREQASWARERYSGLPVEFRLEDYRRINRRFDRIVSVGMFEHVGHKNHRTFMKAAHKCLEEGGLFLLHTIGKNQRETATDPFTDKYIFPNGEVPSMGQIADAADDLFVIEDVHNIGADYDRTLMAWHANFEKAWPRFREELGERFHRMWRYFLLSSAGAFRARDLQVWQVCLSKGGIPGGYTCR